MWYTTRYNNARRYQHTTMPNPDRHKDGSIVVHLRLSDDTFHRLAVALGNARSPQPHDTVGGYIKWLIETQFLRKR